MSLKLNSAAPANTNLPGVIKPHTAAGAAPLVKVVQGKAEIEKRKAETTEQPAAPASAAK